MIRMKVDSTRELKQVARRLARAADGRVGVDARRRLVRSARPVVAQVKTAALAVEVESSQGGTARPDSSTNLRARVAAAIDSAATPGGVTLFVAGYKIGVNGSRLAQYLDSEDLPRWRHPVFGRRTSAWETQTGQPFFYITIRAAEPRFAAAVESAVDKLAEEIMR